MRAGAVYVPFDAWSPAPRIATLAADCGLWGLFADRALAELAHAWEPAPAFIATPTIECNGATATASLPPPLRTSDDLAYLLYTSGSTGTPKGVMLTHAHALNFVTWAADEIGLNPGDRVASHAPFHFDLSIFDLWASLSRGAQVALLDPVTARFPRAVAEWIVDRQITVWYSVPSALVQLLPQAAALAGNRLRAVLFAGEVFPHTALQAWRTLLPQAQFYNWYGPTETNVCTHYRLPPEETPDPLPIGRACPNFELAVLDEQQQPVAPGREGYLWARGPGILAGYWGDPARSAQVTSLRAASGGECTAGPGPPLQRWYNTGDVVRLKDGLYYFLGRRDDVVKCRGYRISLLEVEQALLACPAVRQAVVLALPEPTRASSLAAYVLRLEGAQLQEADLRRSLADRLPAYMIPDTILVNAVLPLTSTGKVDRQRLRQAAGSSAAPPPA